jgi:hypothetical protein
MPTLRNKVDDRLDRFREEHWVERDVHDEDL